METIKIREDDWEVDYLRCMLRGLKPGAFTKQRWVPRDALVTKDGTRATIYTGQSYDPENMTLRKNVWSHDHCEACNWVLNDDEGEEHAVGYFNGYNWLCTECYRLFIQENRLGLEPGRLALSGNGDAESGI